MDRTILQIEKYREQDPRVMFMSMFPVSRAALSGCCRGCCARDVLLEGESGLVVTTARCSTVGTEISGFLDASDLSLHESHIYCMPCPKNVSGNQ